MKFLEYANKPEGDVMNRKIIALGALILLMVCSLTYAQTVYVSVPPPAPKAEVRSAAPAADAIWINGHWKWDAGRYVWIAGYWEKSPKGSWIPGYWEQRDGGYVWVNGYWKYTSVYATTPPPPPKVETRPARPGPHAVWVDGHWNWSNSNYTWISGHWERNPKGHWVSGRWEKRRHGYVWVRGHWKK